MRLGVSLACCALPAFPGSERAYVVFWYDWPGVSGIGYGGIVGLVNGRRVEASPKPSFARSL